jgi:hypothetical protein
LAAWSHGVFQKKNLALLFFFSLLFLILFPWLQLYMNPWIPLLKKGKGGLANEES